MVTVDLCASRGIHVSTMTVTARVVGKYIVPACEYERVFADYLPERVRRRSSRFNNQYTIVVPVYGGRRLNVKVFRNGTLQVSGARSMQDVHELGEVLALSGHMDIGDYKIAMINSNFDMGGRLRLFDLALRFRETGMHVNYDTQRHPGLQLRYMYNEGNVFSNGICGCVIGVNERTGHVDGRCRRCSCNRVTVIAFATGKVVITGARSIVQILAVHEWLVGVLGQYLETSSVGSISVSRRGPRRRGRVNRRVGEDVVV